METTTTREEENRGGMEGETTTMMQEEKQMMMPPVLGEKKKKMKALVAIDESDGSFYALKWALDNLFTTKAAASLPDQTPNLGILYLLHVQQPFQHYIFPAGPGWPFFAFLTAASGQLAWQIWTVDLSSCADCNKKLYVLRNSECRLNQ